MCLCAGSDYMEQISSQIHGVSEDERSELRTQMVIETCYLPRHFLCDPPAHSSCSCELKTDNHYIRLYCVRNMTQYKFPYMNVHSLTFTELFEFLADALQIDISEWTFVHLQDRTIRIRNNVETQSICSVDGIFLNDDVEFDIE